MIYEILRNSFKIIFRILFRVELHGRENIPDHGGFLVISNHASFLDPPLVGSFIKRQINYLAKKDLFKIPLFGWLIREVRAIPIERERPDRSTIKLCRKKLKEGEGLLVFTEDTRTENGELRDFKPGSVMFLSGLQDIPVLPVYVEGSFRALPKGKILPRPVKIRIHYGKPFNLPQKGVEISKRDYYKTVSDLFYKKVNSLKIKKT